MLSFTSKTVILAAGDFPSSATARHALESARRVICCDSAATAYARRMRRAPDAIVGDLDSLPEPYRRRYADIVVHEAEQDDNDLAKAFHYCIGKGWKDIVVLGATGGREDHTLGNIGWLSEFALHAPRIAMVTNHGAFTVMQAPGGNIATSRGMQISFFGFDPTQRISAEGVVFPVKDLPLRRPFTAALNEATASRVTLAFSGSPIVVFREIAQD